MLPMTQSLVDVNERLRIVTLQFLSIQDMTLGEGKQFAVRFRGRLRMDSQRAYALAAEGFRALGYTPLFRKEDDLDVVLALQEIVTPRPSSPWVNLGLFLLTVVSVLFTGAEYGAEGPQPVTVMEWARHLVVDGWPFLFGMLGILLAHELGHYFAARYHKVAVSLPYFLPFPGSPFGTLGAFIRLKAPPTNRRVLLDIGIAGPLAGFVVAVPVLLIGLYTSHLEPIVVPPGQLAGVEGNSILYVLAKWLVFGKLLPEPVSFDGWPPLLFMLRYYVTGLPAPMGATDVILNDVAWAGWSGLLVTGLNLIPAGQLDGGHALYVLVGRYAHRVRPFILAVLLGLSFFWPGWLLWAAIVYFLGRYYAEPLDQITELDPVRRWLAVAALILFLLVFTPVPLRYIGL